MKLMFCMFAEDIGLLPEKLFTRILTNRNTTRPASPSSSKTCSRRWRTAAISGQRRSCISTAACSPMPT